MDLEQALQDPVGTFGSPEEVVDEPSLTTGQKKRILERWLQDAMLLEKAAAENMAGGEPSMLHRVSQALLRLDG